MLKKLLAAKTECHTYLDRIICGGAVQGDETAVLQLLAESVESPLLRDVYFNRGANPKEELAWVKVSEFTKTPCATANALCLAAFHTQNVSSKRLYIRAALREEPDNSLAELMGRAIGYGIIDEMNETIVKAAAKSYQKYIAACAQGV